MGLEIVWSKRAAKGYANILAYLDENWTKKEVQAFEKQVKETLEKLSEYPYLLEASKKKGYRRGPINKLTILTYQVNEKKKRLELINIRSSRQKP